MPKIKQNGRTIPDEYGERFAEAETKRELMRLYGDSEQAFHGRNADGEQIELHIASDSIILKTSQKNGWVRVNYYDENGYDAGETFEGKWRTHGDMER